MSDDQISVICPSCDEHFLVSVASATGILNSAAQARIAELEAVLGAMTEYAGQHVDEYALKYAGYADHDMVIARMRGEIDAAHAALAGVEPAKE